MTDTQKCYNCRQKNFKHEDMSKSRNGMYYNLHFNTQFHTALAFEIIKTVPDTYTYSGNIIAYSIGKKLFLARACKLLIINL